MKIHDAVHALILYDQKKLLTKKTVLRSSCGLFFKFIRVDTQLNWPRIIVEDRNGIEVILNARELKILSLETEEVPITMEPFTPAP